MYLTPTNSHWACDIEADNLLEAATRIWCATLINVITKEEVACLTAEDFGAFRQANPDAIFVGHNFISYDGPMLNRFWRAGIPISKMVDTFVLSQLYNPSYPKPKGLKGKKGPHSLEAWGIRLNYPKGEFEDFSQYSETMLKYCQRDTRLTALLFRKLTDRMRMVGFSEQGAELEHLAWNIIQNKQRRNGFPFDYKRGLELYTTLRAREEELQNEIYKLWPPTLQRVATYKQAFKKDGSDSKSYVEHRGRFPKLEVKPDGSYDAYDYVAFNLGSPAQRIAKLLELGWEPTKFTKVTDKGGGGNPQIDEDSLLAFAEVSGQTEVLALAKWIVINSRANMIGTWLNAYDEKTGAIHGKLFIASTLRYRHSEPNSANIPAVRLKKDANGADQIQYKEDGAYSYETRDLWTCGDPNEWSLVGIDGTGIQNRCLIHNIIKLIGEERVAPFKALSLEGDIHKHNIEVLELANKAAAKKFYYSLMMGAGGKLLAADQAQFGTKMTAREGEAKKKMLIASIPGFNELIDKLQKDLEANGRITLCDDTPILVPSPHMVIPYLLQGDESRLMKKALVLVDKELGRQKLREHVFKVADIHDEWQWRVRNPYVNEFVELALPCFLKAGESFNYRIPIEGDFKVGKTWAETH